MKVGLIDVDSHNFPNLALMKLSAYHKSIGDRVEWWNGFLRYDRVYQSKIFDETYSPDMDFCVNADEIIKGGTGYDLNNRLPDEIEHIMPDYGLYGINDTAYGFLTRGCPRQCPFCITSEKDGKRSTKTADLSEFWNGQKRIVLMDQNILACSEHEGLLRQLADSKAEVTDHGFDARFITKENTEIINRVRLKNLHFAWDLMAQEKPVLRGLEKFKRYSDRKRGRHGFAEVYVLTNYNTTHEEDLYRIELLRSMEYEPYVMVYDKPNAPRKTRQLQRYVNNRRIFWSASWEEYQREVKRNGR